MLFLTNLTLLFNYFPPGAYNKEFVPLFKGPGILFINKFANDRLDPSRQNTWDQIHQNIGNWAHFSHLTHPDTF